MFEGICTFTNYADTSAACKIQVRRAESLAERTKGLLTLPELEEGQGLLLEPCKSVHTFGMKYPLDLVYIARSMQVVKIVESIVPGRMSYCWKARSTLELPAGTVKQLNLQISMQMQWENL